MTGLAAKLSNEVSEAHNAGLETGLQIAEERIAAAEEVAVQLTQAAINTELGRQIQDIRDEFNRSLEACRASLASELSSRLLQVDQLSADLSSVRTELQDLTLSLLVLTEAEEMTDEQSTQQQLTEAEPEAVETPKAEKSQENSERKNRRVFR